MASVPKCANHLPRGQALGIRRKGEKRDRGARNLFKMLIFLSETPRERKSNGPPSGPPILRDSFGLGRAQYLVEVKENDPCSERRVSVVRLSRVLALTSTYS
jgi:hypothetical protein